MLPMRQVIRSAANAIRENVLQSVLAILATMIGAAAIAIVANLGAMLSHRANEVLAAGAQSAITVRLDPSFEDSMAGTAPELTMGDAEDIAALPGVEATVPVITLWGAHSEIMLDDEARNAWVTGTSARWIIGSGASLDEGRFLTAADEASANAVCVVGPAYGARARIGNTIRIGQNACRIVGVLKPRGALMGVNYDEVVIVPTALGRVWDPQGVSGMEIMVIADQAADVDAVAATLRQKLRVRLDRKPAQDDGFLLITQSAMRAYVADTIGGVTAVLSALVAIAMFVAGFGIMNLMLASVTQRTAEIGLRRAIGATIPAIAGQIVIEATTIMLIGALVGVGVAALCTPLIAGTMALDPVLSMPGMLQALALAVLTGLVFGIWPALRAARLDPAEAMRAE